MVFLQLWGIKGREAGKKSPTKQQLKKNEKRTAEDGGRKIFKVSREN